MCEECYCNEDQGGGYTYHDEFGECDVCLNEETDPEFTLEGED